MAYRVRGKPFEKGCIPWNKGIYGAYFRKPDSVVHKKDYKKLLQVWTNMKNRCTRPEVASYSRYGGSGIGICTEWKSFANFYNDMGPSYVVGLTLDRIDNSKGYSKDNCRWATVKEQCYNRRSNRRILYDGVIKPFGEWVELFGLKRSTVAQRYYVYNWSIDRCFEGKHIGVL